MAEVLVGYLADPFLVGGKSKEERYAETPGRAILSAAETGSSRTRAMMIALWTVQCVVSTEAKVADVLERMRAFLHDGSESTRGDVRSDGFTVARCIKHHRGSSSYRLVGQVEPQGAGALIRLSCAPSWIDRGTQLLLPAVLIGGAILSESDWGTIAVGALLGLALLAFSSHASRRHANRLRIEVEGVLSRIESHRA